MIQKWFFFCIFVYFFLILNIFEMKDTSGQNCTAIWSFFSQTSFIEKNSPFALRGFTNFLFLFSLFFPPFSSGHERWSSTGDFIRIPRTRRFFAWIHSTGGEDISVMKCKSQEMERKYQATVINYSGFPSRCSQNHTAIQIHICYKYSTN